MKIRIVKKKNPADIGVVDLSKAAVVHHDPELGLLEIYSAPGSTPARFPEELYNFQYIEISMSGSVCYSDKSAQQIVEIYSDSD